MLAFLWSTGCVNHSQVELALVAWTTPRAEVMLASFATLSVPLGEINGAKGRTAPVGIFMPGNVSLDGRGAAMESQWER